MTVYPWIGEYTLLRIHVFLYQNKTFQKLQYLVSSKFIIDTQFYEMEWTTIKNTNRFFLSFNYTRNKISFSIEYGKKDLPVTKIVSLFSSPSPIISIKCLTIWHHFWWTSRQSAQRHYMLVLSYPRFNTKCRVGEGDVGKAGDLPSISVLWV